MSGMVFDAQLAAKIAIAAGQGAINIVSAVKKSNDMRRIIEDIQGISMDICTTNKKLDALIEMGQDQVLGRLIAANKKLATCIAAKAFTSQDIQTIEELYLLNIGLSKNGKTGAYSNSRIIAYSWWGLILLESQTGADAIKLGRYIVEMFDADFLLARKIFPEICQEFYQPFIGEYNDEECCYITWLSDLDFRTFRDLLTNKNSRARPYFEEEMQFARTSVKDIIDLLNFYGWDQESRKNFIIKGYAESVNEDVNKQWNTGGLRGKVGAVKSAATALTFDASFVDSVEMMPFIAQIFLMDIRFNRMNAPEYQDKRRRIVINMLTSSYLDALRR